MYKLVIFDFDGTLADTFDWFAGALNGVAEQFGFRKIESEEEAEALRGLDSRQILARLDLPLWKVPLVARHMRRLASEQVDSMRLFDGVPSMLDQLRSGARIAIVSSNSEANVRHVLGAQAAANVELYACGASLFGKAVHLRNVLKTAKIAPTDALYIGDEIRDAEAAAKVGVSFGAVSWGFTRTEALRARSPSHLFANVSDISGELVP